MTFLLAAINPPYIPPWDELRPFIAEIWLVLTIVAVLITPFFTKRSNVACGLVALAGLCIALIALMSVSAAGIEPGEFFRGMLVSDRFAILWKVMLLIFAICIVLLWFTTTSNEMHEGDGPEFFTLLLGATLGMALMASTANLLMVFIAVELASLPSYVLAGFRKTDPIGAEASLKYVLFGAATSSIMVYGLSLLYGLYGTLQMNQLATQIATSGPGSWALLSVGLFGLIVGIGFKISAVPFHFWCPDVFEGAGVDVAAFLSVASKGAGLCLLLRLLSNLGAAFGFHAIQPMPTIAAIIGIMGAVTATVGNTAAYVQTNIKRLLAYSSIAHAGYMLCAVSLLYSRDPAVDPSLSAAQAILLYLAIYLFMNLGAFTVAAIVSRQGGGEKIINYSGLGRRSPVLAFCMAGCMFSLIGLPPFAGFVAKVNVMYALGANGGWWWALVAVIGINTIFGVFYYFRVIRAMYLTDGGAEPFLPQPLAAAMSVMCVILLFVLLIGFGPLSKLTSSYSRMYLPADATASRPAPTASSAQAAVVP